MAKKNLNPVLGLVVLLALHVPFAGYAWHLVGGLSAAQSLTTLALSSQLILLALLLLPWLVMHLLGISWNPPRARLNEPLD